MTAASRHPIASTKTIRKFKDSGVGKKESSHSEDPHQPHPETVTLSKSGIVGPALEAQGMTSLTGQRWAKTHEPEVQGSQYSPIETILDIQ